jgi:hypothetical protein
MPSIRERLKAVRLVAKGYAIAVVGSPKNEVGPVLLPPCTRLYPLRNAGYRGLAAGEILSRPAAACPTIDRG